MRVLLTGAQEFLGKLVAARLRKRSDVGLILSVGPYAGARGPKTRHARMKLSDPKIASLVRDEKIDTLVHLDLGGDASRSEHQFEHTVMGSMTLLAAAAEAGARKAVMRSTTSVYGARYSNPTYLDEGRRIRLGGKSAYLRDLSDVEKHAGEFARAFPEVALTILRFAPIIGPTSTDPFMRYLRMDSPPIMSGFDPLVQLLYEEDAADAIVHAIGSNALGAVNVAPEGVTPLLRVLRFLGRPYLPVPPVLTGLSERVLPHMRALPFDAAFLRFTCCGDNARMKREMKFEPRRTTSQALQELRDAV